MKNTPRHINANRRAGGSLIQGAHMYVTFPATGEEKSNNIVLLVTFLKNPRYSVTFL
jgi:hypothetical protein